MQDITEFHNAEAEMHQYRDHLEEIVSDRTAEMKKARDEANRANDAKSEFLSRMSHELRTPLNAILGFGQLLEMDGAKFSDTHKDNISEILVAGGHLLDLVNEVLNLSKIESGKLEVTLGKVSVDVVIEQCTNLVNSEVKKRQLRLIDNLSNMGYMVNADFTRLKQVLLNLLSNAIKYNSNNGCITLSGEVINNQYLRICIADTGKGLSKDSISKLFTSFERLDTKDVDGMGLGLVISKQLTELMEGSIGIESNLGEGSVFWVEFALFNNT